MQLVFSIAILLLLSCFIMPIDSKRKAPFQSPNWRGETTFLSNDDFNRAQNLTLIASDSAPMPIMLNEGSYYEGDMMIQESDENKVAMYTAKRWPDGRIPYIMEDKFNLEERAAIARGIMILQERTCIRFVPKESHDDDYVLMRRGPGCAAHVGRIGGQQWVILGDGCYGIETVTHELMHSVGFIHEQSRPDRDEHVEIVWENIKSAAKRNFKKHDFDYLADHGFPYDLLSVMHYRQYAFSKNRKPTILPKRSVPYLRCRGMDCPSELDIKKINFLYKCHKNDDFDDKNFDKDFDGEFDKDNDLDNEVTVDEMIGDKHHHGGGDALDEHGHSPDGDSDSELCLDGECEFRHMRHRENKVRLYPGLHPIRPFRYADNRRPLHLRKLIAPRKAKRPRMMRMPLPHFSPSDLLLSPMINLF